MISLKMLILVPFFNLFLFLVFLHLLHLPLIPRLLLLLHLLQTLHGPKLSPRTLHRLIQDPISHMGTAQVLFLVIVKKALPLSHTVLSGDGTLLRYCLAQEFMLPYDKFLNETGI